MEEWRLTLWFLLFVSPRVMLWTAVDRPLAVVVRCFGYVRGGVAIFLCCAFVVPFFRLVLCFFSRGGGWGWGSTTPVRGKIATASRFREYVELTAH